MADDPTRAPGSEPRISEPPDPAEPDLSRYPWSMLSTSSLDAIDRHSRDRAIGAVVAEAYGPRRV